MIGINAIVMGISRTEASATAMPAGIRPIPEDKAPVKTTTEGNAQIKPVIARVSSNVRPVSRASPAYPTNAAVNMNAGIEIAARAPRANHFFEEMTSLFSGGFSEAPFGEDMNVDQNENRKETLFSDPVAAKCQRGATTGSVQY